MTARILISTSSAPRPLGLRRVDALTGLNYSEAVAQLGGLPLMVGNLAPELAEAYVEGADGLILTGGVDVDPSYFGAEPHPFLGLVDGPRDRFEMALYHAARAKGAPVLGVCRGHQLINVAAGGTLHQHLSTLGQTIQHEQVDVTGAPLHGVTLEPGSALTQAFGVRRACGPTRTIIRRSTSRGRGLKLWEGPRTARSRRSRTPTAPSCWVCSGIRR